MPLLPFAACHAYVYFSLFRRFTIFFSMIRLLSLIDTFCHFRRLAAYFFRFSPLRYALLSFSSPPLTPPLTAAPLRHCRHAAFRRFFRFLMLAISLC